MPGSVNLKPDCLVSMRYSSTRTELLFFGGSISHMIVVLLFSDTDHTVALRFIVEGISTDDFAIIS